MGLYPKNLNEYVASLGIPRGPKSDAFLVDPVNGSDSNPGTNWDSPLKTVAAAYALCTGDQHDAVLFLSGDTADNPAAAIAWDKDFTHLIGLSGDLPGMGQRCRMVGTAALDLAQLVTFSSHGCIVRNIQFFQGSDAAATKGAVVVSGDRNEFTNCFFAGMGHATNAAENASYSLTVSGSENYFNKCTVGLDTIVRSGTNSELIVSGIRNKFDDCLVLSNSVTAGKFLVKIDNAVGDLRYTVFKDCLFHNYTTNWANGIDNAFDMPASGGTHYVILQGNCMLVGVNSGWADTVTHIFHMLPAPATGGGVGIAVNT
jgi:hypothetical protein